MASEDVLTIYDEMAQGVRDTGKSDWEDIAEALAAEVRELRERDAQRDAAEGELLARVEELRKDKARLDKLWRNMGGTSDDGGGWTAFWSFPFIPRDQDLCGWPDDIRDAIDAMDDAAMGGEG